MFTVAKGFPACYISNPFGKGNNCQQVKLNKEKNKISTKSSKVILSESEHFGKEMIAVVGVKEIQLFECISTSFGFLAKLRNHPRNGRQRENDF
jgi:hypothetical protein